MHLFAKHPMPLLHGVFLAVASHHRTWQLVAGTGMSTQPGWTRSQRKTKHYFDHVHFTRALPFPEQNFPKTELVETP